MHSLRTTGVVVSAALVAALAGGAVGTASADTPRHHSAAAQPAAPKAQADAATLLAQAKTLGNLGGVLAPVTTLVQDALATPVSKDKVTSDVTAATNAIAAAKSALPAASSAPAAPNAPAAPAAPAAPVAPAAPAAPAATTRTVHPRAAADVQSDALAALQTAVDSLSKAVTAGDAAGTLTAATAVITGLVNVAVATVLGGGLPAPNLPGLPALPSLPTTPTL